MPRQVAATLRPVTTVTPLPVASPLRPPEVRVHLRGQVPGAAVDEVRSQLAALFLDLPDPVVRARAKLTVVSDPDVTWPVVAQANVDQRQRAVRVQVAAATTGQAVRLLAARLRARLTARPGDPDPTRQRRWQAQLNHVAGVPPRDGERAVLRRKLFRLARLTRRQAVAQLEELDYDVHLFVEQNAGRDAVVYRVDGGHRLSVAEPAAERCRRVPALNVAGARARFEALGLPFQFFVDTATGRGAVLYHRYDGHFGLVTASVCS